MAAADRPGVSRPAQGAKAATKAASPPTGEPARLPLGRRVLLAMLRGYKVLFSPMFAGSCRFVPSCSEYAADAVTRFGVLRGSWLAIRRLGRCRPLAAHGFDPVPPAAHD